MVGGFKEPARVASLYVRVIEFCVILGEVSIGRPESEVSMKGSSWKDKLGGSLQLVGEVLLLVCFRHLSRSGGLPGIP